MAKESRRALNQPADALPKVPISSPDGTDVISVTVDMYESIQETAEIKSDNELMAAIAKSDRSPEDCHRY